jgi:hypothetical protein
MEGGENRRPVDQRYQRPHPASGNVTEELYTADHPLLYSGEMLKKPPAV